MTYRLCFYITGTDEVAWDHWLYIYIMKAKGSEQNISLVIFSCNTFLFRGQGVECDFKGGAGACS